MNSPQPSTRERKRVQVLREYNVLHTPPEKAFDELTALAAHLCGAPVALITFVDETEEWCKSAFSSERIDTARTSSFCALAMQQEDLFIVPDATLDKRFADNPTVTGDPHIRFYAGAPLISREGQGLGALCVLDDEPRDLSSPQRKALQVLGRHVMTLLELRRRERELASTREQLEAQRVIRRKQEADLAARKERGLFEELVNSLPGVFYLFDQDGRYLRWNKNLETVTGYSSDEIARMHPLKLFRPEDHGRVTRRIQDVFEHGRSEVEVEMVVKNGQRIPHFCTGLRVEFEGRPCLLGMAIDVSARRQAEAERDRLFKLSPDMFCISGSDGYFKEVNPAWEKTLGFTKQELLACPYIDLVHPDDRERTLAQAKKVMTQNGDVIFENRYRCKDGSWKWLAWTSTSLPQKGLIYSVARDVTKPKQTQDALEESEARFEAFMDDNPAVAWMKDEAGRYVYANNTLQRVYGPSIAQLLGKTDFDFLPEATANALRENDQAVLAANQQQETIEVIPDVEGRMRSWSVWKFPFVGVGDARYVGGLAFDITDRLEAEEALRHSEGRYRCLVEGARDAIFALSSKGLFTSLNAAFETMTGWERDEWLGRSFTKLAHPEDLPRALEAFKLVLNGISPPPLELRVLTSQNVSLEMELTVTPQWQEGKVTGCLGIARDISKRRHLEEQLRQMQKIESIGQLAAGIAHDFNNLLTVQQGHTTLLLRNPDLPPEFADSLRQIAEAGDRAASLTRQLLLFSSRQIIRPQVLNLNEVVTNLAKMLKRILGEDIDLRIQRDNCVPTLKADPGMIEQVIMNLAVNARDAMPEGGRLDITTSRRELDEQIGRENPEARPGQFVCLKVSDTGVGIPADDLAHIFEPFFTTKDVGKGTGLGLATVHGIVRQHQGWIEVESQPGVETSFTIFLPASTEEVVKKNEPMPPETEKGAETILVVEDEAPVRNMVRMILEHYGYTVLMAGNGPEALQVWEKHSNQIDLLISDLVMPEGISGLQLAEQLQENKPQLKILLSSGYSADLATGNQTFPRGTRFLQKPYSPDQLIQCVQQLLDERRGNGSRDR